MSTHGVHAGSIEDMWQVAIEVAVVSVVTADFPVCAGRCARCDAAFTNDISGDAGRKNWMSPPGS